MKTLIKLLTILSISFSCACAINPPDSDICVVNAGAKHLTCFNLKRDYNEENGALKPDATPTFKPVNSLDDLNKFIVTDADSFERIKIFTQQVRYDLTTCKGD
jgi:hypothetical protein